jgi:hypothetical protein
LIRASIDLHDKLFPKKIDHRVIQREDALGAFARR